MKAGETLYDPHQNPSIDQHLWVVISDPVIDPQQVVMVSFTSQRADKDQSCIIHAGEHDFVNRETLVYYAEPRIARDADLERLVAAGLMAKHASRPNSWPGFGMEHGCLMKSPWALGRFFLNRG